MGPLALVGGDSDVWGSVLHPYKRCSDLITLRPRDDEDSFSHWVANKAVPVLFRCGIEKLMKPSQVHGMVSLSDSALHRVTFLSTTVVASVLPVASILALYFVSSTPKKLAVIACFNILVAICLSVLTKAKRMDIFAITAAYVNMSR
jgi:hypothetical protein